MFDEQRVAFPTLRLQLLDDNGHRLQKKLFFEQLDDFFALGFAILQFVTKGLKDWKEGNVLPVTRQICEPTQISC